MRDKFKMTPTFQMLIREKKMKKKYFKHFNSIFFNLILLVLILFHLKVS